LDNYDPCLILSKVGPSSLLFLPFQTPHRFLQPQREKTGPIDPGFKEVPPGSQIQATKDANLIVNFCLAAEKRVKADRWRLLVHPNDNSRGEVHVSEIKLPLKNGRFTAVGHRIAFFEECSYPTSTVNSTVVDLRTGRTLECKLDASSVLSTEVLRPSAVVPYDECLVMSDLSGKVQVFPASGLFTEEQKSSSIIVRSRLYDEHYKVFSPATIIANTHPRHPAVGLRWAKRAGTTFFFLLVSVPLNSLSSSISSSSLSHLLFLRQLSFNARQTLEKSKNHRAYS
jgi:hypothetical protein